MPRTRFALVSVIAVYFTICFEILIMISPFAGFFYSAFSPPLAGLAKYQTTRWLTAFFFTHMVVPPTPFLKLIRILGSVTFTFGLVLFLVCAIQVYASKFLRRGPVTKGLYAFIRHPQYFALGMAAAGLAILWPRFLVVVLWLAMVLVYYFLAKDEERRMLRQHPDSYQEYMRHTGMFLPRGIENLARLATAPRKLLAFILLAGLVIGGAFLLRDYTVRRLPVWSDANVVALAVLPEDNEVMNHRMASILGLDEVSSRMEENQHYLVYFLPPNYIMQGLIADTGGQWHLYMKHRTISRFADWIFHPFTHLGGPHGSVFQPNNHLHDGGGSGPVRRLIFVRISGVTITSPADEFSISARRIPDFMVDVDVHSLSVRATKTLAAGTAWGDLPTPTF